MGGLPHSFLFFWSGEVDSWEGFLTHFLRKEYGTFRLYSGNEGSQIGDQLLQGDSLKHVEKHPWQHLATPIEGVRDVPSRLGDWLLQGDW